MTLTWGQFVVAVAALCTPLLTTIGVLWRIVVASQAKCDARVSALEASMGKLQEERLEDYKELAPLVARNNALYEKVIDRLGVVDGRAHVGP